MASCRTNIAQIPVDERLLMALRKLVMPYLNDEDGEELYNELLDLWDKYKGKVNLDDIKITPPTPREEDADE